MKWNRAAQGRERVFCASMADVMEDRRDLDALRARLWDLIDATPNLDWLLCTKRPENFIRFLPKRWFDGRFLNVWLLTTVESEAYLRRLDDLAAIGLSVIRGVSYEPALGPVDFRPWLKSGVLNWVIAGGESGSGSQAPDPDWFRSARDQCAEFGVAFFFKQWGGVDKAATGRVLDGREWNEVPA